MDRKKIIYIIIGVLILALVYWFFIRKKAVPETAAVNPDEALIQKEIAWMRKDPATVKMIKDKAAAEGRKYEEQLRLDAMYYVTQNKS